MSDQTLDWDDVLGSVETEEKENPGNSGGDFEALPAGPYEVVVQEASKEVSKSSGNDMIKVRVQVASGPYANRVLFSYITFAQGNPKAMRLTLERLAAFGVTREVIATTKPSIPQIAELLVGQKATAVVAIQDKGEYKGRNEVKSFKPIDGATPLTVSTPAASKPGVPNIPTPQAEAAAPTPSIPVPDVPTGEGDAADPFAGG